MHVGTHQCAVRVVVLEERNERGGDGDELLRRDVDVVHFGLVDENEVALAAGVDDILHDVQLLIELDVGLRDGVAVFFPRGEVEAEGGKIHGALLVLLQLLVLLRASVISR